MATSWLGWRWGEFQAFGDAIKGLAIYHSHDGDEPRVDAIEDSIIADPEPIQGKSEAFQSLFCLACRERIGCQSSKLPHDPEPDIVGKPVEVCPGMPCELN
jgi:hypothetical protein